MTNKKIIEILKYILKLLENVDLVEQSRWKFRRDYQRRINKAYDELFELIKVLEADEDNE